MKERTQISKMDLNVIIGNLRKSDRYNEQQIQLIQDDLLYGLSKEETERYTQKNYDFKQMQVYSRCLRNDYSDNVIAVIAADGLTSLQMEVALEFYEKGIPIETISKVAAGDMTAVNMKRAYQRILNEIDKTEEKADIEAVYVKQLVEEIKEVVSKLDYQDKRYDALNEKLKEFVIVRKDTGIDNKVLQDQAEKDTLLIDQQNKLNEAHAAIARLKSELEGIRKEKDDMQIQMMERKSTEKQQLNTIGIVKDSSAAIKETSGLSSSRTERESHQLLEMIPVYYGVPIGYSITLVDENTVLYKSALIEKEVRKSSGLVGLFSKLAFKKKSRQDLVKLIASKELLPEQLMQIKSAMEKGLTEGQLLELINNKISAEQMKEIIEIAVLENSVN
ncbi:MAG: hypothetical protein ACYDEX_14725 [Mobilitalea sp.]